MKPPRKAIVLAAGFGSRLAPITHQCPKPLIPLHGKPMIVHVLEQLQSWGVDEVLVNVHHLAEVMVHELPSLVPEGMKLNLSFEPSILGTGGGLRRMAWFFSKEPLWVCNADVWQKLDPKPLLNAWEKQKPLACLWMVPDKGPRTVKVEKGKVKDFHGAGAFQPPKASSMNKDPHSTLMTFSGLHLINQDVLPFLPDQEFSSVITAYDKALAAGRTIIGLEVPGSEWADIGTPNQLLETEKGPVIFPSNWLLTSEEQKRLPEVDRVELMPARGSDRTFRRLISKERTEILIRSGEERPENLRLVKHTRFLDRKGFRVPEIYKRAQKDRWLQVEDLGGTHLLDRLQSGSTTRNQRDMRLVLELIARFHSLKVPTSLELEPAFGPKLYAWERDLFKNEFLSRHAKVSDFRKLEKSLFRLSEDLADVPQVLIHRDLQSTNIMWLKNNPGLIDFQGMRMGSAAYDLGSLLADPYVNRSKDLQRDLVKIYNRFAERSISESEVAQGAVQRLLQALGAYGRLGAQKENQRFLRYIPAALTQLTYWAEDSVIEGWAQSMLSARN